MAANTRLPWIALPLLASSLVAQDMVSIDGSGEVRWLDSFSGTTTSIGTTPAGCMGLARDGLGQLWTVRWPALVRLDPNGPVATAVFPSFGWDLRGLTSAGGPFLWGIANNFSDTLVRVDTTTGTVTTIGPTVLNTIAGLVEFGGVLYGWDVQHGLVVVDRSTGVATDVNPAVAGTTAIQWLAVRADGRLVGGLTSLYEIDVATGAPTLVAGSSLNATRGAVPLPSFTRSFGTACNGAHGPAVLAVAVTRLPTHTLLTSQSVGHAPLVLGALSLGLSNSVRNGVQLPISLDPLFGTQGCSIYTSLESSRLAITSALAPATLDFAVQLPVNVDVFACFAQHVVLEPVLGGVSTSNGVVVQFGW
ncbi:MAG: hypothetical protein JNK15_05040 [Planctomycetes bacterium]|nr:hypothetical protein [Planctomycetota bacterium]